MQCTNCNVSSWVKGCCGMERLLNSAEEDLIKKIEDVNARLAKIENQLCQILAEKAVNPLTEGK